MKVSTPLVKVRGQPLSDGSFACVLAFFGFGESGRDCWALAALVWSYFGRLDVHATASGKIEPAGYSKVIEPLDAGKVAAIHVEKGQTVKAGDLLLELDPAEANADALSARDGLNAGLAEIARRRFAIDAVFCDKELKVIDVVPGLSPWKVAGRKGAKVVIELAEGSAVGVDSGDQLVLATIER